MHPLLADVYMTAMADQMAAEQGMTPVSDETASHLAVGGVDIDRIATLLLGNRVFASRTETPNVESTAACVAFRTVLPKNLSSVPVDKILALREKYPGDRGRFQEYIRGFATKNDWLASVRDPNALEERIRDEFDKTLDVQLDEMREKLHEIGVDSVTGVLSMKIETPSIALALAGLAGVIVSAPLGIAAGIAFAAIPVLKTRKKELRELRAGSLSFLLRAEEELKPIEVANWLMSASPSLPTVRRFRAECPDSASVLWLGHAVVRRAGRFWHGT